MIKYTLRSTIFVIAFACATGAFAQTFFQNNRSTHAEVRDDSNILINGTTWGVTLQTAAADPALFINNMSITGSGGYNPLINMQTQTTGFDFNGSSSGHYNFGTAITGDNDWNFAGAFHNGAIDAAVADGVYDFTLDILGGGDNAATNTLASFGLHVDVLQKLDITTTLSANPGTIFKGGPGTEVSMTVTNHMDGRNFITSTWYVSAFGDGLGHSLAFDGFTGNWFNQVIAPTASHTDSHSQLHADLDTPIGTYTSFNGVVGGTYENDFMFMTADQQANVNVLVPEPASFAVLGLGALALVRRRKSKKA
jgi:hypothetical protein